MNTPLKLLFNPMSFSLRGSWIFWFQCPHSLQLSPHYCKEVQKIREAKKITFYCSCREKSKGNHLEGDILNMIYDLLYLNPLLTHWSFSSSFSSLYSLTIYIYYIVRGPQYSHRIQSWSRAVTCALRHWPSKWWYDQKWPPGDARGHSISISIRISISRHQSASTKILSFWLSADYHLFKIIFWIQ